MEEKMTEWQVYFVKKALLGLLGAILALWTVAEYLALPALLIVIGVLNGFGWKYYLWTLGGYTAMVIVAEWIGSAIGNRAGRGLAGFLGKMLKSKERSGSDSEY